MTKLLGAYFSQENRVWIVMEFCFGSVYDCMTAFKAPLTEPEIQAVALNVTKVRVQPTPFNAARSPPIRPRLLVLVRHRLHRGPACRA